MESRLKVLKSLYVGSSDSVNSSGMSNRFDIKSGVRQGVRDKECENKRFM